MLNALRASRQVVDVLLIALVGAVLLLVVANAVAPRVGDRLIAIRGASMEPALPLGSLVVATAAGSGSAGAGDVVTVRADNGVLVTHRIVRRLTVGGTDYVQTKGDANASADPDLVPVDHIVGRMEADLPLLGYLLFLLGRPLGALAVLTAAATLIVAGWLLDEMEAKEAAEAEEAADTTAAAGAPEGVAGAAGGVRGPVRRADPSLAPDGAQPGGAAGPA